MWLSGSLRQAAAICALAVVDVPGDGNCLFHALAMQDEAGRCGEELRAELANFLESEAFRQDGFEEVWLEEAEHLRGPAAECWGGAVAISAYSLLRQRRVFVHVKVAGSDVVEVQDSSHAVVDADAPVAHLLYNGVDHYKALIEAELSDAMVPAWPQPPPPRYFAPAVAEAAGATAAAVYAEDCVRLRAEGKGLTSRPGVSKSGRRRGRPQAGPLRPRTWPRAAAARPARSGAAPAPPLGKDHAGGAAGRRDGGSWQSLRDPRSPDLPPPPPFRGRSDGVGSSQHSRRAPTKLS